MEIAEGTLHKLLDKILAGDSSQSVIAILLVVCGGIIFLWHKSAAANREALKERDKLLKEMMDEVDEDRKEYNNRLLKLTEILAEIKTVLSVMERTNR